MNRKKKIIILLLSPFCIFLFYMILESVLRPFNIEREEVLKVTIFCIDGEAIISKREEIEDTLRVINRIKAIKGDASLVAKRMENYLMLLCGVKGTVCLLMILK